MSNTLQKQALALINRSKKILCVTQHPAKTDGISCLLATRGLLKKMGKEVVTIIPEGLPEQCQFFPGDKEIGTGLGEKGDFIISLSTKKSEVERVKYTIEDDTVDIIITPKSGKFSGKDVFFNQRLQHFDLIIIFDAPNLESLGSVFSENTELFSEYPILNISNQASGEDFGKVNIVDPSRSSSSEILFNLVKNNPETLDLIDKDIATILLSGIIVATGSFLEQNTTASSLESASQLQELGATQSDIIDHFFKKKSFCTLKIWGRIFGNLQLDPVHKIAWSHISSTDLTNAEATKENIDQISNDILRFIQPSDFSVLFIEDKEGGIQTQIRSNRNNTDWTNFKEHFEYTETDFGINTNHPQSSLSEVESEVLHFVFNIQKQKLNIDYELPIQKTVLTKLEKKEQNTEAVPKESTKKVVATAPEDVPFIAPFQPHEKIGKMPSKTKETETSTVEKSKKGIPEWLKKSFPEN